MRSILKIQSIGLFLMLLTLGVNAQPPGGGPGGGRGMRFTAEDVEERARTTAISLELNAEQTDKFVEIELDFFNRMQIERQKMRNSEQAPDREEMRARMTKNMEEHDRKVEEVLTEEQFRKYTEMREQRRREMQEQRQDGAPEERPQRGRGRG